MFSSKKSKKKSSRNSLLQKDDQYNKVESICESAEGGSELSTISMGNQDAIKYLQTLQDSKKQKVFQLTQEKTQILPKWIKKDEYANDDWVPWYESRNNKAVPDKSKRQIICLRDCNSQNDGLWLLDLDTKERHHIYELKPEAPGDQEPSTFQVKHIEFLKDDILTVILFHEDHESNKKLLFHILRFNGQEECELLASLTKDLDNDLDGYIYEHFAISDNKFYVAFQASLIMMDYAVNDEGQYTLTASETTKKLEGEDVFTQSLIYRSKRKELLWAYGDYSEETDIEHNRVDFYDCNDLVIRKRTQDLHLNTIHALNDDQLIIEIYDDADFTWNQHLFEDTNLGKPITTFPSLKALTISKVIQFQERIFFCGENGLHVLEKKDSQARSLSYNLSDEDTWVDNAYLFDSSLILHAESSSSFYEIDRIQDPVKKLVDPRVKKNKDDPEDYTEEKIVVYERSKFEEAEGNIYLAIQANKIEKINANTFERTDFIKGPAQDEEEDEGDEPEEPEESEKANKDLKDIKHVCADEVNGLVWFMTEKQQIFKADINTNEWKEIDNPLNKFKYGDTEVCDQLSEMTEIVEGPNRYLYVLFKNEDEDARMIRCNLAGESIESSTTFESVKNLPGKTAAIAYSKTWNTMVYACGMDGIVFKVNGKDVTIAYDSDQQNVDYENIKKLTFSQNEDFVKIETNSEETHLYRFPKDRDSIKDKLDHFKGWSGQYTLTGSFIQYQNRFDDRKHDLYVYHDTVDSEISKEKYSELFVIDLMSDKIVFTTKTRHLECKDIVVDNRAGRFFLLDAHMKDIIDFGLQLSNWMVFTPTLSNIRKVSKLKRFFKTNTNGEREEMWPEMQDTTFVSQETNLVTVLIESTQKRDHLDFLLQKGLTQLMGSNNGTLLNTVLDKGDIKTFNILGKNLSQKFILKVDQGNLLAENFINDFMDSFILEDAKLLSGTEKWLNDQHNGTIKGTLFQSSGCCGSSKKTKQVVKKPEKKQKDEENEDKEGEEPAVKEDNILNEPKGKLVRMMIESPLSFVFNYETSNSLILPTNHKELDQDVFLDNIIEEDEIKRVATKLDIEEDDDVKDLIHETKMIVPRTLNIPQYLDITTQECIDQLKIYQEASTDLLESSDLNKAIYYRLNNEWYKLFAFNFVYILQAIFMTNYIIVRADYKNNDHTKHDEAVLPLFLCGCFLTMIELIQVRIKGYEYFQLLNLVDFSANILVLVNFFRHLTGGWTVLIGLLIYYKMLMSLTIMFQFRSLITMIIQCVTDMIPFLVLVAITTVAFATLNLIDPFTDGDGNPNSYPQHIIDQYRFMYGENPDSDTDLKLTLYVLFSLFMCIVMLNLLIAIISETFAQVTAISKSQDLRQVCEILIEFGELQRFICRRRHTTSAQYLHFFQYLADVEEEDQGGNQLEICKTINNAVTKIRDEVRTNSKKMSEINQEQRDIKQQLQEFQTEVIDLLKYKK